MSDLLHNLIQRQKTERATIIRESTITREMAPRLKESLSKKLIKVVIGPRRCGKSSLVHQVLSVAEKDYAYLNFEDEQFPYDIDFEQIDAALTKIYPNANWYFFDEIQTFPRWEQLLNRLERLGKKIIVSGSNSKLLSSELSSVLTGRHELLEMFPFSFYEYGQVFQHNSFDLDLFKKYLQLGGFPDVALSRVHPQNYLRELWDAIVLKDIVQRYKIRSVTELKALLSIFKSSLASRLSLRSLERAMQKHLSVATIGKFLAYAEGAYLTFSLNNFSFKSRERVNSDKKAYLVDNGFFSSVKVGAQEDFGRLLENFIFVTLLRKGLKANFDFFYYKTNSGQEIDFLILENGKPTSLIQVCWSLSQQKTLDREISAITEAQRELGVDSAYIVTANENQHYSNNIKAISIQEYLVSIDWK